MRDYKSSLLILLSVLLLISFGLLFTVFYHFYYKTPVQEITATKQVHSNTSTAGVSNHDSLLQIYTATILDMDKGFDSTWNNADSLKANLDIRISEFYKLRNEIKTVLKESRPDAGLGLAKQKIIGLQERIAALRYINMDVENENKRLNASLNKLIGYRDVTDQNILSDGNENRSLTKNISKEDALLLFELHFSAVQINDDKEEETNRADQTEKLQGSFKVKNKNIQNSDTEIMVVVLQPDGKVLQNSDWEAGTFATPEGKKVYSGKLRVEYNQGETKQLLFSVTADKYQQGNYTLKIYHNGVQIGKIIKTLS